MQLAPLASLSALTHLEVQGPVESPPGGDSWLPNGLRRLTLAGAGSLGQVGCGGAWLACIGGCGVLEALNLMHLRMGDLQLPGHGVEELAADALDDFYGVVGEVRGREGGGAGR